MSSAPFGALVDKALHCQFVDLQKRRRHAMQAAMLADSIGYVVILRLGDLRVRHVVHWLIRGLNSIENFLGLLGSPAVGQRPKENGLLTGYGVVRSEIADAVDHVIGNRVILLNLVQGIEKRLQFYCNARRSCGNTRGQSQGKNVRFVARDDAKIVTGPFHTPKKVAVTGCVDADCGATG